MKCAVLVVAALGVASCRPHVVPPGPAATLGADVAFLASPALEGREAATPGADSAAVFIARRYEELGLQPAFRASCDAPPCAVTWFQSFRIQRGLAQNVGAVIAGMDSLLRDEYVVLGAHYDHLGRSPAFAHDPELGTVARAGADDNASGTAAVLELARRFRDRPARRSIVLVNFDAEERGLIGSRVFVAHAPVPRQAIRFMLNLDMIGRLRANRLIVENAEDRTTRALADSAVRAEGLFPYFTEIEGLSDHASFAEAQLEAVHLSTGHHVDYHKASDIPARVNLAGLERVVNVAESLLRRMADR